MAKKETTQPVEQQVEQDQSATTLSIQDLVLVAQIIQVSTQRGAFRAEELSDIGNLYTKLIAFLQAAGALKPADAAAPTEE